MKQKTFKSIQVDDLVYRNGRVWRVTGVYLGCSEQENGVGLKAMGLSNPCVGKIVDEMIVPMDLIDHDDIFRQVNHEREKYPEAARAA